MSLRSILLVLDDAPSCADRTRFAIRLAKAHGARLVGLAPMGSADFPIAVDGAASIFEYAEIAWRAVRERAERGAQSFREACEDEAMEFAAVVDESAQVVSILKHAHSADLVVVGQADRAAANPALARQLVEDVVTTGSRPTLVVPEAGRIEASPRTALVAWDGSRQADRALLDALPLLHRCDAVWLEAWAETDDDASSLRSRLQAVCDWLARHEVRASPSCEGRRAGATLAETIRSRAAERGADLIVMGAYGRSRWSERILGGTTRGLLDTMTVPLLMSH